jgi:hypothetical protein
VLDHPLRSTLATGRAKVMLENPYLLAPRFARAGDERVRTHAPGSRAAVAGDQ